MHRRSEQRSSPTFGLLTTALTISVVLLLLATTFLADWLRIPGLSVSAATQNLSPNGDRDHDQVTVNYELSEEAQITARVLGDGGGTVRLLLDSETQPAGQHFLNWDGRSEIGAIIPDGRYRIEITASGPLRSTSQSAVVQVDTRSPSLQLVNLPNETRVGQELLTVQGITDPDATVWASGEAQPLSLDAQGRFSFQRKLLEGSNLIEVRAVDPSGNTNRIYREIVLVTTPPDLVLTKPVDGEWTNQSITQISGQAPVGALVTINDQPVPTDDEGKFEHELLLEEGENRLRITATDDVGNISTLDRLIYLKTSTPEIRLNVAEGAVVSNSLLQIVGHTEAGSTVIVNGRVVPVSALGDFQTTLFLSDGENTLQVQARDQAGNTTTITRLVRFEIPESTGGLTRLYENVSLLPTLAVPALLAIALLLAIFFIRQGQVALVLSVDQSNFAPGLPGENKVMELALDLNKPARISLEVLDKSGYPITTLLNNRRRTARVHIFHWNGYDDYGRPLDPGEYTIKATAGTPPVRVTSAVQINIRDSAYLPSYPDQRQPLYKRSGSALRDEVERRRSRS